MGAGVLPFGGENSRPLQTVGVVFFEDKPNLGSRCGGERWPIDFGSVAGLCELPWGGRAALRPGGAFAFAGGLPAAPLHGTQQYDVIKQAQAT